MVLLFQVLQIITYSERKYHNSVEIDFLLFKDTLPESIENSYTSDIPSKTIDSIPKLLQNNDFILPVKLTLWMFFWLFNEPEKENIELFENFLRDNSPLPDYCDELLSISGLKYSWPLLTLAIKANTNQQGKLTNFLDYLDGYTQISIYEEIHKVIEEFLDKADGEEKQRFIIALKTSVELDKFFPQLISTARNIGIKIDELVGAYLTFESIYLSQEDSPEQLKKMLTTVETAIQNREKPYNYLWPIFTFRDICLSSSEVIDYACQIFELFLEKYSESYSFPPASLGITLFLKLLECGVDILDLAPNLFTTFSLDKLIKTDIVDIHEFLTPYEEYVDLFRPLLTHSDKSVRIGSALIFKAITDSYDIPSRIKRKLSSEIPIDFSLGIEFIYKEDTKDRLIGITLLSLSDYPIEEKQYQHLISNNLQHPKTEAEEEAWNNFLKEIPMDSEKHLMWRTFLEEILRKPAVYSSSVLSTAMERYLEIVGKS